MEDGGVWDLPLLPAGGLKPPLLIHVDKNNMRREAPGDFLGSKLTQIWKIFDWSVFWSPAKRFFGKPQGYFESPSEARKKFVESKMPCSEI